MPNLLVKANHGHGRVAHVTPQSAGWTYVGFDLHRLHPGETVSAETGTREVCLVFITGKGKAAAGALVVFHPAGSADPRAVTPTGKVQEDGSFTLTTAKPGDGAPAGEYDVAIVWQPPGAKPNEAGEVPSLLPARYGDPKTSKLRVKVEKGPNNLPPFKLTP